MHLVQMERFINVEDWIMEGWKYKWMSSLNIFFSGGAKLKKTKKLAIAQTEKQTQN